MNRWDIFAWVVGIVLIVGPVAILFIYLKEMPPYKT